MEIIFDRTLENAASVADTERSLLLLLGSGCRIWTTEDGAKVLIETRVRVDQLQNLKIYIYSKEHAPPHFHVVTADIDATFSIADGSLLKGSVSKKDQELIEWWYGRYRDKLVRVWNDTRPSDCPVGIIEK